MIKKISSVAVMSLLSQAAFAVGVDGLPESGDIDTTSAEINWVANIPTVVSGNWITMTGSDGGSVKEGVLSVANDGSFESDNVVLEIRQYDADSGQIGGPVEVNPSEATPGSIVPSKITYQVEPVSFSSEKGVDTTGVVAAVWEKEALMQEIDPGAEYDEQVGLKGWQTVWSISNKPGGELPLVIAGDKITATTVVRADVEFAAK
ncbi:MULTISPECIES: hypothetical protein [Pseudomonadati]|uniref:Uncharacterized protein n=2 Tax=Vibrio rumoiensis TaxID=76258 RepID=A0ABW7J0T6_9VIBR